MYFKKIQYSALAAGVLFLGCSADNGPLTTSEGGSTSAGGVTSKGGASSGGITSAGAGGTTINVGSGGASGGMSGGYTATVSGGMTSNSSQGGASAGTGAGGRMFGNGGASAGASASGGKGGVGSGGAVASGGATATAGTTSSGAGAGAVDCNAMMPTGGTEHKGLGQGGKDNLAWQLWANNANNGSITTFSTPAFGAQWADAGDYLARIGYEWGNAGKTYDAYGTITAQFAYTKTGSAGGYSYIGIYGWSNNPCVEWYIVDDSFNKMPVNPGSTTNKGTVTIDGGDYILYTRQTNGTGGSRCNVSSWVQYYSVRKTARQCGTISISQHFDAWKAAGMSLGTLLEAKILVEVGGGTGSVEFPVANVQISN